MLNSELIIIGHGRTNNKESTQLITKHARSIKERGIFSRVRSGFLNIGPYADNQLATATSESIFIVPCFASAGSLTQRVIPQKLGIKGPVTIKGKTKIYYCTTSF